MIVGRCCRALGGEDDVWYGRSELFFRYKSPDGIKLDAVLVSYFEAVEEDSTRAGLVRMRRLRQARVGGRRAIWYDVISADRILYPVYMQPDPTKAGCYFLNHYIAPYQEE